jgi:stage V sporulation protein B
VSLTAKEQKQNFLTGAAILAGGIALVKVLGALFRIPLFNLIGSEANGYFTIAHNIFNVLLVVSTTGFPIALSKMVAESTAAGRHREGARTFRVAFLAFASIGAAGSLALLLGARFYADTIAKSAGSYWAVLAIAPNVLFVMLASSYRGFHQGRGNMIPTATSQIIEAAGRLFIGFTLAWWLLRLGRGPEFSSAGAILGVTAGTALCTLFLAMVKRPGIPAGGNHDSASYKALLKRLIKIAVPITIGASMLALATFIDGILVVRRLQDSGLSEAELHRLFRLGEITEVCYEAGATALYGMYGAVASLFNLPTALIAALTISIIPAVSAALARKEPEQARGSVESALRVMALIILPAGLGLSILSWPILNLLYPLQPVSNQTIAPALAILGPAVLFCAFSMLTNAILQAYGKVNVPIVSMLCGGVVKIAVSYTLVGNPSIGILGAAYGTLTCYAVIAAINLAVLVRYKALPPLARTFLRSLAAAAGMGLAVWLAYPILERLMGARIGAILGILAGVALYMVLVIVFRAIRETDLLLLPKGEKIAKLLRLR